MFVSLFKLQLNRNNSESALHKKSNRLQIRIPIHSLQFSTIPVFLGTCLLDSLYPKKRKSIKNTKISRKYIQVLRKKYISLRHEKAPATNKG